MSDFRTETVDGIELRLRPGNPRKCLVMLHGIGSNFHSFDRLASHLPDDWMLVVWNAPGYGSSKPLAQSRPIARHYSDRLHDLVQSLGLSEFSLAGHSLGTIIAVDYASRFPGDVRQLVLIACAQGYGMGEGEPLPEKAATRLADLTASGPQMFAQQRAPRLLFDPDSNPEIRDEAIAAMSAINPSGYSQAVHLLASGNLSRSARSVNCSSLTIVGEQDVITPPNQSELVHAALKNASAAHAHTFCKIGTAGHLVHQEQPAEVAAEMINFTENLRLEEVIN